MSEEVERRVTRSAKHSGKVNRKTRQRDIDEIDVDERENVEIEIDTNKPTVLCGDDDVSGKNFYKQDGVHKKGSMLIKAKSCIAEKDPFVHLERIASLRLNSSTKNPDRFINGLSSDIEESVSEDSEYEPEDSGSDASEEFEDEIVDEEDEEEDYTQKRRANYDYDNDDTIQMDAVDSEDEYEDETPRQTTIKQDTNLNLKKFSSSSSKSAKKFVPENDYKDMHMNTEEYFESQSEKILTSNRTLGRLKTAKLDKKTIDKLLEQNLHISESHHKGICRLNDDNISRFPFWHFLLEEGFSILLHGLGSKRNLIHDFYEQMIKGRPTLIVNGFFPSLTLKEILDGIIKDLMDLEVPTGLNDSMDLIENTLKKYPDDKIYLLIHNLDGPMLRSKKVQDKLSYLASIPNLHLVASVDHINASLLWDNAKRARYNFYWCNATTFLPYKEETLYENSLMVRQSGALALSSLRNVFLSLPDKSRSVYTILVNYQIENANANYQGMAFKELYQKAREGFFVTNEITLRSQLTEFLDHKLVKEKRGVDGIQYLTIPLDKALLQQFLEQQEES